MSKAKKFRNKGKPKTSLFKLSNKRLNKLAKQGKLKKKVGKKKLVSFLKHKTTKTSKTEPIIEPVKAEPDIPLHEADYEYYTKPGRNYKFLSEIQNTDTQIKRKRNKNNNNDFDLVEGKYAKKSKFESNKIMSRKFLLPLICKEKGIIHQYIDDIKPIEKKDVEEVEEPMTENKNIEMEKFSKFSKLSFNESKELIATISLAIIETDQENVNKLKDLFEFISNVDIMIPVRVLAMISLSEIFKDIIPGYSIRAITEQETKQQMKKDTKQLFDFEQTLLNNYCKYLEVLESYAKGKYIYKDDNLEIKKLLRITALKCLSMLLITHPHFNYRTNIISVIMPFILHKDNKTNEILFDAIKRIFREDKNGVITLEIVRLIGRIIKTKNFNVKPKVLDTFLSLKIKEIKKPDDDEVNSHNGKIIDYSKRNITSKKKKVPTATLR